MDYILAIIAGLIQGTTEFLPISSSGHLVLFHEIMRFNFSNSLLFDIVLHLGTLVALLICFWRDLLKIIKGFFQSIIRWNVSQDINQKLAWIVVLGTIPAALIGYFFEDIITSIFHEGDLATIVVTFMLALIALLFLYIEKIATKNREITNLNWFDSLIIGLAQSMALIPGTSRSGITIITGMWFGLKREAAAKFSFLLSIPIILGAGLKSILDIESINNEEISLLLVGFLSAAISGIVVVKFLLKYLERHSLSIFAWYRLILAAVIFLWLIFNIGN